MSYQDNSPPPTTAPGQLPPANSPGTIARQDNSPPRQLPLDNYPPKANPPRQ